MARVIVTHIVIWLKKMSFKSDSLDVIKLDTLADLENDETLTEANNQPEKLGGNVTWHNLVMTTTDGNCVTLLG